MQRFSFFRVSAALSVFLSASTIAVFVLAFSGFWYVSSYSRSLVPTRSFSVEGEGKVVAVPDVAELSFGILTEGGKNLSDLQKENSNKANRIVSFVKESGVADKDIKTQYYSITPRYQYFSCPPVRILNETAPIKPCPPQEIVGYSISQNILVKARDLNKAGDIVAGVVERGANTVSGPTFTIDDPDLLQQKAREEAILKAKDKAKATASAGSFRLGKLISVSEREGFPIPFRSFALEAKGGDLGGGTPPIEPGSQEVKVNVMLVYEIK